MFCTVYFQRVINRAVGSKYRTQDSIHSTMSDLAQIATIKEYYELIDLILSKYILNIF